jgi:hypothetical protein
MVGLALLGVTGSRGTDAGRFAGLARCGAALCAARLLRRFAALGPVAPVFFFMGIF